MQDVLEGIDNPLAILQSHLVDKLDWLDRSFGKCQVLTAKGSLGREIYPAIYESNIGREDYQDLRPNDNLGNFSFFVMRDPEKIGYDEGINKTHNSLVSLIFWYNIEDIQGRYSRSTESIRMSVINTLSKSLMRLRVTETFSEPKNVYQGFTLSSKEEDVQYNMHPYAVLRVDFNLIWEEEC